ncbi:choice-of-anchor A family protein [Hahella sp. NBU794]|uniref:choice-of-anchor A family protein n=1 Tax=Hahella sp. NBU794 TaxID=3422590 RepID=UPI003D6ECD09
MISVKQFYAITLVGFSAAISANTYATPVNLGAAANYNGFFHGDFTSSPNDSEGALAVGGNASLTGYTLNSFRENDGLAIVVGGDYSHVGGDIHGDALVGGQFTTASAGIFGTVKDHAVLPINFDAEFAKLTQLSKELSLADSLGVTEQWGALTFNGDSSGGQQIFNISEKDFESVWGFFAKDIGQHQELIINVAGDVIDIDPADYKIKASDWSWVGNETSVIFNFYEATQINLAAGFYGTILAPGADIFANGGHVDGQVIAHSWQGANQLNWHPYEHNVELPEPATFGLMLSALAVVGAGALRRKPQA